MPSFSAASATLSRSASFNASALNSAVYLLFVCGVGFLLMDHLWSNFTQFLRCPILVEGINKDRPTGNWVHPFGTFSDIVQAIQAQVLLDPPHEAIMQKLLVTDLSAILSQGLLPLNGKVITPTKILSSIVGNLKLPDSILDDKLLPVDEKSWSKLAHLGLHCMLISFSPPMALQRVIETGLFLEYDIHSNEYRESPVHSHLCILRDEINLFNKSKDNNSLNILSPNFRRNGMNFPVMDFVSFLHILDRWSNILELSICLLNYLKYGVFNNISLRPSSPIPSEQADIEREKIDALKIEDLLKEYR